MAESFDPRESLRTVIGTKKAVNPDSWNEADVITFTSEGFTHNIPIYLSEESASLEEPPFPFIDINLMNVSYSPCDIGAEWRKCEAYLDVGIWFTASDNYTASTFGKALLDELVNQVRTEQVACGFGSDHFANIRNISLKREGSGRQVVYHYVVEIYFIYYD